MEHRTERFVEKYATPLSIVGAGLVIALGVYGSGSRPSAPPTGDELAAQVIPADGITLPFTWGDLGAKLVATGVIDRDKMVALYQDRGGFPPDYEKLLATGNTDRVVITRWNAGYLLNLLWALGLANDNPILRDTDGMMNPRFGGAGNFASTGGWTLARGSAMDHYGMHRLVSLTNEQQALVDRVSRNIYRPCCGNATHFPDCNHGMAMLGMLELMAAQGVGEEDMYRAALAANSFWFPENYLTIAAYEASRGVSWEQVSPKDVLGSSYSSASGYQDVSSKVTPPEAPTGGNGCSA